MRLTTKKEVTKLYSREDISEYLSCSVSTVRRLILKNNIRKIRIGGIVRYKKEDFDNLLKIND